MTLEEKTGGHHKCWDSTPGDLACSQQMELNVKSSHHFFKIPFDVYGNVDLTLVFKEMSQGHKGL